MPTRESHPFELQLTDWSEVHELPGDWEPSRMTALLEKLEIDEVPEAEQLEMALMGLQDLDLDEAADFVLESVFGSDMSAGVRQKLISELEDDRPWEDFVDLRRQPGIFSAVTLLQKAFPTRFGIPDGARVEFSVRGKNAHAEKWLAGEVDPALLVRLLAEGMSERSVIRRLFGTALAGDAFPEARAILWRVERRSASGASPLELLVYSSLQWLGPLEDAESWSAVGWPDVTRPTREV